MQITIEIHRFFVIKIVVFEADFDFVTTEIRWFRFLAEILAEADSGPKSPLKSIDFGVAPSQGMLLQMLEMRHTESPVSRGE